MTFSAETRGRLEEFVYDEGAQDGQFTASIAKGIFRFIPGKIARAKQEKVRINLPSATLGMRGAAAVGEITGERCLISFQAEEGGKTESRIVVAAKTGDLIQEVEITQPGFATVIEAEGKISSPIFQLP